MTFSFYGILDLNWIESKMEEYRIYSEDILELVEEFGYDSKAILDSPNPIIFALLECIARQLFEYEEVQELSDGMRETFYTGVYDTFFINCLDSHMTPYEVVESNKEMILEDYKESFPELSNEEINNKYQALFELCEKYSF